MNLKPLLFGAAVAATGCHLPSSPAEPPQALSTKTDKEVMHDKQEPDREKPEEEILAELRNRDRELDSHIFSIRDDARFRIKICVFRNKAQINTAIDILTPLIDDSPEFAQCKSQQEMSDWSGCVFDILTRQGKTREMISFLRISNDAFEKVDNCVFDESLWDPALTDVDYSNALLVDHPDPDIRSLIEVYMSINPNNHPEIKKLENKHGRSTVRQVSEKCGQSGDLKSCYAEKERADMAFVQNPTKQTRIDQLKKDIECQNAHNKCILDGMSGKK